MTTHKWKIGDKFKINPDFSMAYDADDDCTGTVDKMVAVKDEEQEVAAVLAGMSRRVGLPEGIVWLMDSKQNYVWRSDWVSPMIEETG